MNECDGNAFPDPGKYVFTALLVNKPLYDFLGLPERLSISIMSGFRLQA